MRILTCNSYKGLGPKILVKKNKWHRGRVVCAAKQQVSDNVLSPYLSLGQSYNSIILNKKKLILMLV